MAAGRLALVLGTALLALASVSAAQEAPVSHKSPVRVWIDTGTFAEGETDLLKEALERSGGRLELAGESAGGFLAPKGFHDASRFDVYWTGYSECLRAFAQKLGYRHFLGCIPGTGAITGKRALVETLRRAYGAEGAAAVIPRSFALPGQYLEFARAVEDGGAARPWVVKQDVHRGKGVSVLAAGEALAAARGSSGREPALPDGGRGDARGAMPYAKAFLRVLWPFWFNTDHPRGAPGMRGAPGGAKPPSGPGGNVVVAQRFLGRQMLVHDRPFYIRLWVVLVGQVPLRAHLFEGGVVVFGSRQNVERAPGDSDPSSEEDEFSDAETGLAYLQAAPPGRHPGAAATAGGVGDSAAAAAATVEAKASAGGGRDVPVAAPPPSPSQVESANNMVVNMWLTDREASDPWPLAKLWRFLDETRGPGSAARTAAQIRARVAAAAAAAAPAVRAMSSALPGTSAGQGGFAVLGVDFLLDEDARPWLVEVNWLPSMARKVVGAKASGRGRSGLGPAERSTSGWAEADAQGGPLGDAHLPEAAEAARLAAYDALPDFDAEKIRFIDALLDMIAAREREVELLALRREREAESPRPLASRCLPLDLERQLRLASAETTSTRELTDLSPLVARSLGCMAEADPRRRACRGLLGRGPAAPDGGDGQGDGEGPEGGGGAPPHRRRVNWLGELWGDEEGGGWGAAAPARAGDERRRKKGRRRAGLSALVPRAGADAAGLVWARAAALARSSPRRALRALEDGVGALASVMCPPYSWRGALVIPAGAEDALKASAEAIAGEGHGRHGAAGRATYAPTPADAAFDAWVRERPPVAHDQPIPKAVCAAYRNALGRQIL